MKKFKTQATSQSNLSAIEMDPNTNAFFDPFSIHFRWVDKEKPKSSLKICFIELTTTTIEVCDNDQAKVCTLCGVLKIRHGESILIPWFYVRCRQPTIGTMITITTIPPNDAMICEIFIHYSQ